MERALEFYKRTKFNHIDWDLITYGEQRQKQREMSMDNYRNNENTPLIFTKRKSSREFCGSKIEIEQIKNIARSAIGYIGNEDGIKRAIPSAGGIYGLNLYICALNVEGLEYGLYHYNPYNDDFVFVSAVDSCLVKEAVPQLTDSKACVLLLWTAEWTRYVKKYGERGLRYLYIESGHSCQNAYLTAAEMGIGICAIGAYDEDILEKVFDLSIEMVVYCALVGKEGNK